MEETADEHYPAVDVDGGATEGNRGGGDIETKARGFRRFANYRSGILFCRGERDLSPKLTPPAAHTTP